MVFPHFGLRYQPESLLCILAVYPGQRYYWGIGWNSQPRIHSIPSLTTQTTVLPESGAILYSRLMLCGVIVDTISNYFSLLKIWNIVIFIKINMSIHLKCHICKKKWEILWGNYWTLLFFTLKWNKFSEKNELNVISWFLDDFKLHIFL